MPGQKFQKSSSSGTQQNSRGSSSSTRSNNQRPRISLSVQESCRPRTTQTAYNRSTVSSLNSNHSWAVTRRNTTTGLTHTLSINNSRSTHRIGSSTSGSNNRLGRNSSSSSSGSSINRRVRY